MRTSSSLLLSMAIALLLAVPAALRGDEVRFIDLRARTAAPVAAEATRLRWPASIAPAAAAVDQSPLPAIPAGLANTAAEPVCHVVFCSRKSEPWGTGHSFVVWIKQNPATGAVDSTAYGFYPGYERVVWSLFRGSGAVVDESTRAASVKASLLTHRLVVRVDQEAYVRSLQVKDEWASAEHDYNLLARNCTHFAHEVSRAIGMPTAPPKLGERPPQYLRRMMDGPDARP